MTTRQKLLVQVDLLIRSFLCSAWIYVRGPRDDCEDVLPDTLFPAYRWGMGSVFAAYHTMVIRWAFPNYL